MIDLHIHSNFSISAKDTYVLRLLGCGKSDLPTSSSISDTDEPIRMIESAAEKGAHAISLTEHWSLDSLKAARQRAEQLSIEYIPGIEIGALLEVDNIEYEVHILGYFFSEEDPGLQRLCENAQRTCDIGARAFLSGLPSLGINISPEKLERDSRGAYSGWSVRRLLVAEGYARNKSEATQIQQRAVRSSLDKTTEFGDLNLDNIIDAGDIVRILHDAGGIAFMAHPFWLTNPSNIGCAESTIWRQIDVMLSLGADGIEVSAPCHSEEQKKKLLEFCRNHQIPACGGSDCRTAKALSKARPIGDELLDGIKRFRVGESPWV